jgi:LysM repeat protein
VQRIARHAWVLAIAATLCVLVPHASASASQQSPHRFDDIVVSAVIEQPPVAPVLITRHAQTVVALPGQSVDVLAAKYHSDVSAIRWANRLSATQSPTPGRPVLLPPGPGALVEVRPQETPSVFAARVRIDPSVVLDYNTLVSNSPMSAGTFLQVPLQAAPVGALIASRFVVAAPGIPGVPLSRGPDTFPFGQCTWFVASKRDVTWGGNAISWWWSASHTRPEGHVPVQGAIVVLDIGWAGHVALVDHVNADGSFDIEEMNYWAGGGGWGRVDHRILGAHDSAIVGFIY